MKMCNFQHSEHITSKCMLWGFFAPIIPHQPLICRQWHFQSGPEGTRMTVGGTDFRTWGSDRKATNICKTRFVLIVAASNFTQFMRCDYRLLLSPRAYLLVLMTSLSLQILLGRWQQGRWGRWIMQYKRERGEMHATFWSETLEGRDQLIDTGVEMCIRLKLSLRKENIRIWNGFNWLTM